MGHTRVWCARSSASIVAGGAVSVYYIVRVSNTLRLMQDEPAIRRPSTLLNDLPQPIRPRSPRVLKNDLVLHEAVIKNDADAVRNVLKESHPHALDVNSRNNYGRAPIHWAASRGNTEIMRMLVEGARCDIEARDKYGMRPILMAAWHGHRDAVQLLIKFGANVLAVNKKECTLLMCASRNNRLDVVNFLLDTLEDIGVDLEDSDGQSALFHAAQGGHHNVVKRLIEAGANTNTSNKQQGRSALHAACERGHTEVVELLLQQGGARDLEGNSPLHVAAENRQTNTVQLLLDSGACPPDPQNKKGYTPLHLASSLGCRGIIELLVQHGASLDKQTKNGNTALHVAVVANEFDTVELLISKGADVNALNARLQSAIHIAAEQGFTELCKLLLSAGANIHQKEQGGKTPLYIAARGSFTTIVDLLIRTARLDYPTKEGDSSRRKWRQDQPDAPVHNERLRELLWKVAYKQLGTGEWKRLAHHWSFTDDQIKAIEHQHTGPGSHKEHGFRLLLIWAHGLPPEANPVKELYEALAAVDKKGVAADALRNNEEKRRRRCASCVLS